MEQDKHNMSYTPEYRTWTNMKQRCYNPNFVQYKDYGGCGIGVSEEWRNSFIAFYVDMGPKPFPRAQIDRINNCLGYSVSNCRWVIASTNARNRKTKLTMKKVKEIRKFYATKKYTQKELAKMFSVTLGMINHVINNRSWKE